MSLRTVNMKLNKAQERTGILDNYSKELSDEQIQPSSRWKTIYKSSYAEFPNEGVRNNTVSTEAIPLDEVKGLVDPASTYTKNYGGRAQNSKEFLKGNIRLSFEEALPIQQIANNPLSTTAYGSARSMKCNWFDASGTNSSWRTMYQTEFRNLDTRFPVIPNNIKSQSQYRLEQVYRHMGNRVCN